MEPTAWLVELLFEPIGSQLIKEALEIPEIEVDL